MASEIKLLWVLLFLFTTALCDKKLNLEDIERDHIRSDVKNSGGKKTTKDTVQNEDSKYLLKAEVSSQSQQQYHGPPAPPQELGNQVGDYAELQSYGSFKYATQPYEYSQDNYQQNKNAVTYLQHGSDLVNPIEHHQSEQQQYVQEGRSNSQNDYDALQQQQQFYQQKVLMGNQLQNVQQEAVAHKYVEKNQNKGAYYMNIPSSQILSYYQNYGMTQSNNKDSEQNSIPIYIPAYAQNQVYTPTKVSYQPEVQYVSSYPKHTQVLFTKTPKGVATSSHTSTSAASTNLAQQLPATNQHQHTVPIDVQGDEAYTSVAYKPQKYEYYVTQQQQSQPRFVQQPKQPQQVVYENSGVYADIYSTPSTAYGQDNSLFEQHQSQIQVQDQHNQLQQQHQQYYVPTSLTEQYMTQLLHQAGIQQAIKETQESLHRDFSPPQYQAQKFRASHEVTHLTPVDSENEGFHSKPIYSSASVLSQPKTLLDSYVPSHVIAAQDANRYRERPIKLESGFLPSKINFIRSYKKRKTE